MLDHAALSPDGSLGQQADLEQTGSVEYSSWLSEDILLLTGWFHAPAGQPIEACLVQDEEVIPLEVRYISYPKSDPSAGDRSVGKVMTVRFLRVENVHEARPGRLLISTGSSNFSLGSLDLFAAVDVLTVLKNSSL